MLKSKKAFTLAEILITLGIIGVVAAMTIPTLINQTTKRGIITAFNKDFSDISNALMMVKKDNGGFVAGGIGSTPTGVISSLENYMKFVKVCSNNSYTEGCFDYAGASASNLKMLNGAAYWWATRPSFPGAILPNGSVIIVYNSNATCTSMGIIDVGLCANIMIDVNGPKSPNIYGRDLFDFYITEFGLIPKGSHGDTASTNPTTYGCREAGGNPNGEGCAARILRDGTQDY